MNRCTTVVLLLLLMLACKNAEVSVSKPDFPRWASPAEEVFPFSGDPEAVTEIILHQLADTNFSASGDTFQISSCKFGSAGELLNRTITASDGFMAEMELKYTADGVQTIVRRGIGSPLVYTDSTLETSKRFPDGRFLVCVTETGEAPAYHLLMVDSLISIRRYSYFADPTVQGKPQQEEVYYYEYGRPNRYLLIAGADTLAEKRYFFNGFNFLDSIHSYSRSALDGRELFIPDRLGNPISYTSYGANGDLLEQYQYSYRFDNHGNWIQRLRKTIATSAGALKDSAGFGNWELTKREFQY